MLEDMYRSVNNVCCSLWLSFLCIQEPLLLYHIISLTKKPPYWTCTPSSRQGMNNAIILWVYSGIFGLSCYPRVRGCFWYQVILRYSTGKQRSRESKPLLSYHIISSKNKNCIFCNCDIAKLSPAPVAAGFSQISWAEMVFIVNFHPTHPPNHPTTHSTTHLYNPTGDCSTRLLVE